MSQSRDILVLTGPHGRRFGMRREITPVEGDPNHTTGGYMVYDLDAGTKLGDAAIACQPILTDIAGEQHVLFAGTADRPEQKFSAVNGHRYSVVEGAWMSFPEPFTPGTIVTVTGLDEDGKELFRIVSPPLYANRLVPMFGPSWSTYAPAD